MCTLLSQPVAAMFAQSTNNVISKSQEYWTCVDYSKNFTERNPEWGMVTLSDNQLFHGTSHMLNYKILDNGQTLLIHDGMQHADYKDSGWYISQSYYHFWQKDETPARTYKFLRDNRQIILKAYNITEQSL
jgi:hypothetical protein